MCVLERESACVCGSVQARVCVHLEAAEVNRLLARSDAKKKILNGRCCKHTLLLFRGKPEVFFASFPLGPPPPN